MRRTAPYIVIIPAFAVVHTVLCCRLGVLDKPLKQ